jgi:hypothetical protein
VLLSDEQIDELSSAIQMKLGHKLKFPVIIQKARQEMQKQEEQRKREEEEQEEQKEEQESKRRREKEQRKREEEEQQEQKELEHELSKIERQRILNEAKDKARSSTRDADDHEHADKAKATEPTENNKATDPAQYQTTRLPDCKDYAAFISHKKMHTQFADSSETLSIRLKVHGVLVCTIT